LVCKWEKWKKKGQREAQTQQTKAGCKLYKFRLRNVPYCCSSFVLVVVHSVHVDVLVVVHVVHVVGVVGVVGVVVVVVVMFVVCFVVVIVVVCLVGGIVG